jgi:hypothetical protein
MSIPSPAARVEWGAARRIAFYTGAALLGTVLALTFVGVTALTIGLWAAGSNADTTPVADLGFFALGGILVGGGILVQLRHPERRIAGLQQSLIALIALSAGGAVGLRIEPLTGALLLLAASIGLVALHPARASALQPGARPSLRLALLVLGVTVPATLYASEQLRMARAAGPSCFLGVCAYGDRFAELAALLFAIVGVGLLAAAKTRGWPIAAWSAGLAALTFGAASLVWPQQAGSAGITGGALAVAWALLFVATAEWERRRLPQIGRASGRF